MPESPTAEIIPFPIRPAKPATEIPAVQVPAESTSSEARLSRALAGLTNAVTTQRAAMTAWKTALSDLRTVTGRLAASLQTYNDSLGHLDARVNTLRAEAARLETRADGVLAEKV